MGTRYGQLALNERASIGHLRADGLSIRKIGEYLGRSASTISRELKRNGANTKQWKAGYDATRADGLAARRRCWDKRFKMARQPDLQTHVKKHLAMGWSPEQIAGRLAHDKSSMAISHESIYRFIYYRVDQKDYSWHTLLPRQKYYRGNRPRKGGPPSKTFQEYVSIDDRPDDIADRKTPGHWEADLMAFKQNKQVMLIAVERTSRKLIGFRQPNKTALAVQQNLCAGLRKMPENMRLSITYDNGTEFAHHHIINKTINTKSYFCHVHSPWQKGSVENAIGRLRRKWPSKTDINALPNTDIQKYIKAYNNTPRKCLAYLTPNEAFDKAAKAITVALQT